MEYRLSATMTAVAACAGKRPGIAEAVMTLTLQTILRTVTGTPQRIRRAATRVFGMPVTGSFQS